jgi:hypothetical protein
MQMQVSEIYRQRAAECERMAVKHPEEREQLQQAAKSWRFLAKAAEQLAEAAKTLH